jgi:hypothetical protein
MRCAQALSGQLSAFERHEIVAACKEYGGIVIQQMWGLLQLAQARETDGHDDWLGMSSVRVEVEKGLDPAA